MANVLEKIVADKRVEIEQRKKALPLSEFVDGLQKSNRSFYEALSGEYAGFIFECKKASPSKGLIRENFDLDEIIAAYKPYAACISVLTDEKYFQGKFEYLRYVRENLEQPVLNKDFFVDPYQVHLARHNNADAILLMLSVLDDETYQELAALAEQYSLDVLTEVSNEEETHRAIALGAKIIGINNRNLRDLSTDLAMTEALVPIIRQSGHECLIISESGIYTHADVQRLAPLVDGFLVGSSMMAENNLARAVKTLLHGSVKVCGITRLEDAKDVANSAASFAGLIFYPQSKRFINLEQAKALVTQVPFNYVGVFVDAPVQQVVEYANELKLFAVQLHGEEQQDYIERLRRQLPEHIEIWQAKGVTEALPSLSESQVDKFLLDCKVDNQSGGTGQQFDWRLLQALPDKSNIVLAGGLTPDNLQEARQTGVHNLDLNSGVESQPGIKSTQKIQQALAALRAY